MTQRRLVHWTLDPDVLDYDGELQYIQQHRTVSANSDIARTITLGSIVLCAEFEIYSRGHLVRAIAQVKRKSAGTTRRRRVRLEPFWLLSDPIDLEETMRGSDHHIDEAIREAIFGDPAHPKLFTARSTDIILNAVAHASDEARHLINNLSLRRDPITGLDGMRLREERDAVSTCLDLAGLSRFNKPLSDSSEDVRLGQAFGALGSNLSSLINEDDLITHDLRKFDMRSEISQLSPSAFVIQDQGIRLTVINVNRKRLERVHGVDLVYYDETRDQATAVQYKRLEGVKKSKVAEKWVYHRKAELEKQLELMHHPPRQAAGSSEEWRMSPSPTFFKFVKAEDFDPRDDKLLWGMYVPSDYLALGIRDESFNTGPRGGFEIHRHNTRYLSRSVFVELVRGGWIGTSKTDKSSLGRMVKELAADHEVLFGIRSKAKSPRHSSGSR